MNAAAGPWTHRLPLARLAAGGTPVRLVPTAEERAALAAHVGALEVPALAADLTVTPDGKGGARVEGRLEGRVVQACVVTLEPVEAVVAEPVAVRFRPTGDMPGAPRGAEIDLAGEPDDPPEPIEDGKLDLGRVLTELFTLGIDPYPRKPGVAFEPPAKDGAAGSPFAALAKLRDPPS